MGMVNQSEFNEDKLQLVKSGRVIKLMYDKEPFQFCTSTMYTPFGVKGISKEWSTYTEFNVDCSVNQSNSANSMIFRQFIEKVDSVIKKRVDENIELFNTKSINADENYIYSPILRENGNYPKLMKITLPRDKNGNFESFIFDESKNKVRLTEDNVSGIIKKGRLFKCIIECVKVWYYNGKVGSIWKVVQMKFSEKEVNNNEDEEPESRTSNIYTSIMIEDD